MDEQTKVFEIIVREDGVIIFLAPVHPDSDDYVEVCREEHHLLY